MGGRGCLQGPERDHADGKHDDGTQTNCAESAVRRASENVADGCDKGAERRASENVPDRCGEGAGQRAMQFAAGGFGEWAVWRVREISEDTAAAGLGTTSWAAAL